MLTVSVYIGLWLVMGTLTWGVRPISGFYAANLIEAPAYLVSAATAWKWPFIAELIAGVNLVVILIWFHPWTAGPLLQKALHLEYAFIIAANVAFLGGISLRRAELKSRVLDV